MKFIMNVYVLAIFLSGNMLLPLSASSNVVEHATIEDAVRAGCWQCLGKRLEELSWLIKRLPSAPCGSSKNSVTIDLAELEKSSAFHAAAARDDAKLLEMLIKNDDRWEPAKHRKNVEGNTPMHFAAQSGSVECLRLLLAADTDRWDPVRNMKNNKGQTPLKLAMLYGHAACALLLAQNQAKE